MKRSTLIFSVLALFAGAISLSSCQNQAAETNSAEPVEAAAKKGAIVYFNLDRVLNEYDMANDLSSVVQTKAQSIEQELTRRGNKLQGDINTFQQKVDKGLFTRSVAEAQSLKLQQQQSEFETFYNQKQQEMQEEQAVMMNQIADAIKTFVDKFNAENGYAMIIATQGDILPSPVVTADPELDITDAILAGLNAEYVQNKNSNK
ncbi:MAG: OmpH family outer membrane protein [Bacteroidales bacterium]|nr:OmpH family outer membrane protein [Bacteroidales bacterium]MCI5618569.1 OmpH family outer membrane protein [Rikenellaceae bacterium]